MPARSAIRRPRRTPLVVVLRLLLVATAFLPGVHTPAQEAPVAGETPEKQVEEVPAEPVTHVEAETADHLKLLVRPMTKDELEEAATAWRDRLKEKVAEIAQLRLAAMKGNADPTKAPPPEAADMIAKLQDERTLLGDQLRVVLDEWEKKGGDPAEFRTYAAAVSGLEVDVKDTATAATVMKNWLVSEQGGVRWGWNIVKFLAILVGFWILSRILSGLTGSALARIKGPSSLLRGFLVSFVRLMTRVIGIVVAVSALEINTNPLLALIGGAAFVVGLALQGTLANFAHGLLILAYRPFDIGDVVDAGGVSGIVHSMNLLSTTIRTFDNKVIIVPNSKIGGDTITNASASDTRRVDLTFGIGYGDDTDKAQAILERVVAEHPLVLKDPAPVIKLNELADSSVNFVVRPWVKGGDYWQVHWDLLAAVKKAVDREGVTIPFPQHDVHVHQAPR